MRADRIDKTRTVRWKRMHWITPMSDARHTGNSEFLSTKTPLTKCIMGLFTLFTFAFNAMKNHRVAKRTIAHTPHKRSRMTKEQTSQHLDNFPLPFHPTRRVFFLFIRAFLPFMEFISVPHPRAAESWLCTAFQFWFNAVHTRSKRCNFENVSCFTRFGLWLRQVNFVIRRTRLFQNENSRIRHVVLCVQGWGRAA